jgi:hypothetical protein
LFRSEQRSPPRGSVCTSLSGGTILARLTWRRLFHDPSNCICDAFLCRRQLCPIPCKCPVAEPCLDRTGFVWSGIGARDPRGALSSAPERSPRSGTRRQYCTSAVGRDAGSFNDAGNVINIGIGFEITVEEMIELFTSSYHEFGSPGGSRNRFALLSEGGGFRSNPPLDSGDALHIDLTAAQKQTVYQSVSKAQKNNAPQRAFRATVGPLVPTGRHLAPVPATIADLMPQGAGIRHGRGPSGAGRSARCDHTGTLDWRWARLEWRRGRGDHGSAGRLKLLFSRGSIQPPSSRRLDGRSKADGLDQGTAHTMSRAGSPMKEAKALFSPKDDEYAFGEWMRSEREIWQPSRRKRHRPACLNSCRLKTGYILT